MPGEHQLSNASGAFEALQCMQDKLPLKREAFESALKNTRITGRFSKVRNAPEVYLDVGHNPHAAKELAKTLSELPKATCQAAVFGMLSDKDRAQVCQICMGRAAERQRIFAPCWVKRAFLKKKSGLSKP